MKIRIARIEDLPFIVKIYNQSILSKGSTCDLNPVLVEDRKEWFDQHNEEKHPIFVAEIDDNVVGWCSLSAYRLGRMALRYTAEISYFIDKNYQGQGLAKALVEYAISRCPLLKIKNLFAIILELNRGSVRLLEQMGFQQWGYLPRVADFDGRECGHLYYGRRVWNAGPDDPKEG
jgi:phosphinothricin acetyltransferase